MQIGPGSEIAGFRLEEQIGAGGMGVVYRARQLDLDRTVALKLIQAELREDQEFKDRFRRESRLAASIDHPNVVPIFQAGEVDGAFFIAMRYVAGTDLGELLSQRQEPLPPIQAAEVVAQVAAGLDAAHAAGLVHRDVKPANILLDERHHAYLTDFGLTKQITSQSLNTKTGVWLGSVNYSAPEQIESKGLDARTDVYALGCVLFEALTKQLPYERDSDMALMWAKVHQDPRAPRDLNPELPRQFDEVIARALARDADDRYPSAGDLGRAARAAAVGEVNPEPERTVARGAAAGATTVPLETPREPPPSAPAWREAPTRALPNRRREFRRGRWALIASGALAAVAIGALAAMTLFDNSDGGESRTETRTLATTVTQAAPPPSGAEADADAVESSAASQDLQVVHTRLYSAEVPAGWIPESIDEEISGRYESQWRNPSDENTSVLIDSQVNASSGSPLEDAAAVRAQTSQTPGYREISFGPTYLGGSPAARWVFELPGDRRVDYFVTKCNVGFAILGSSSPSVFGAWAPLFHQVATSVTPACE